MAVIQVPAPLIDNLVTRTGPTPLSVPLFFVTVFSTALRPRPRSADAGVPEPTSEQVHSQTHRILADWVRGLQGQVRYMERYGLQADVRAWSDLANAQVPAQREAEALLKDAVEAIEEVLGQRLPVIGRAADAGGSVLPQRLQATRESLSRAWNSLKQLRAELKTSVRKLDRADDVLAYRLDLRTRAINTSLRTLRRLLDSRTAKLSQGLQAERTARARADQALGRAVEVERALRTEADQALVRTDVALQEELAVESRTRAQGDLALQGQLSPLQTLTQTLLLPQALRTARCAPAIDRLCRTDPRMLDTLLDDVPNPLGLLILAAAAPAFAEVGEAVGSVLAQAGGVLEAAVDALG